MTRVAWQMHDSKYPFPRPFQLMPGCKEPCWRWHSDRWFLGRGLLRFFCAWYIYIILSYIYIYIYIYLHFLSLYIFQHLGSFRQDSPLYVLWLSYVFPRFASFRFCQIATALQALACQLGTSCPSSSISRLLLILPCHNLRLKPFQSQQLQLGIPLLVRGIVFLCCSTQWHVAPGWIVLVHVCIRILFCLHRFPVMLWAVSTVSNVGFVPILVLLRDVCPWCCWTS